MEATCPNKEHNEKNVGFNPFGVTLNTRLCLITKANPKLSLWNMLMDSLES